MKQRYIIYVILLFFSCEKDYEIISKKQLEKLLIQDTLIHKNNYTVMQVGRSTTDAFPKMLLKKEKLYLFENDSKLKNDSTILSYFSAFIIDSQGSFRENGIWVYTEFYTEGYFPLTTKGMRFHVDSIPTTYKKKLPNQEGIYFYEEEELVLLSSEQSEEKFKEKEKNGFYFIPNSGRLFNTYPIDTLD